MSTNNLTETPVNIAYNFVVGGEKGQYDVCFVVDNQHLKSKCTCMRSSLCWHVEYILAGKTSRIIGGDASLQGELITRADNIPDGRHLIRKAKKKFTGETHCRRCNSEKIVRLKSSLSALVFTLFKETTNHAYYCKGCGWTW